MKHLPLVGLCAVALGIAACTRVVDAVTAPGVGAVCTPQSTDPDCKSTAWPTGDHTANSDPWLVSHNQVITEMRPNVLVLNFDTGQSSSETKSYAQQVAGALAAGSIYHGYSDATATPFLNYQIGTVVDLTSVSPPTAAGAPLTLDPTVLFTDPRFPPLYGYPDSNGGYRSLCDLFELGIVNEVWIQDGGDATTTPRAPLYAERKQMYDQNGAAITGRFQQCTGGFQRRADGLLSQRSLQCDRADGPSRSLPGGRSRLRRAGSGLGHRRNVERVAEQLDRRRLRLLESGLHQVRRRLRRLAGTLHRSGPASPILTRTGPSTVRTRRPTLRHRPFTQGCGSSLFPPNATARSDLENTTTVNSRCEHFGLLDGMNGMDTYLPYSNSVVSAYDQMYTGNSQCPAGWQIYWRQSMPGYQNHATATDGTPMKNWWPMLFY